MKKTKLSELRHRYRKLDVGEEEETYLGEAKIDCCRGTSNRRRRVLKTTCTNVRMPNAPPSEEDGKC